MLVTLVVTSVNVHKGSHILVESVDRLPELFVDVGKRA
jgi:hypothetical protein